MNGYDSYLETRIMSADPVELVRIMYQATVDSVGQARQHLAEGRIKERSAAITRAVQLLGELSASLNHEVGGEISQNLARLYDYMQRRLLEANAQQRDEPLAEVESLLSDLQDAWKAIGNLGETGPAGSAEASEGTEAAPEAGAEEPERHWEAAASNPWAVGSTSEVTSDYASHSWSV